MFKLLLLSLMFVSNVRAEESMFTWVEVFCRLNPTGMVHLIQDGQCTQWTCSQVPTLDEETYTNLVDGGAKGGCGG